MEQMEEVKRLEVEEKWEEVEEEEDKGLEEEEEKGGEREITGSLAVEEKVGG